MRQLAAALIMSAMLSAAPSYAFDASGADLLGVRLNMSEAQVTAQLTHQGFSVARTNGACSTEASCIVTLKATTKDGELRAVLIGEAGTKQIDYVFFAHGVGEAWKIQSAMTDRFGNPSQQKPMIWCRAVTGKGLCPADQASLAYVPETLTMTLKSAVTEPR